MQVSDIHTQAALLFLYRYEQKDNAAILVQHLFLELCNVILDMWPLWSYVMIFS